MADEDVLSGGTSSLRKKTPLELEREASLLAPEDDPDVRSGASSELHQGPDTDVVSRGSSDLGPDVDLLADWRSKFPIYKEVPDDDLAHAIAEKYPKYRQFLTRYIGGVITEPDDTRAMAKEAAQNIGTYNEPKPASDFFEHLQRPFSHAREAFLGPEAEKAYGPGVAGGVMRGIGHEIGGQMTPLNAVMLGGMASLGGPATAVASLGMGALMAYGAVKKYPQLRDAVKRSDWSGAAQIATEAGLEGVFALLSGAHGMGELTKARAAAKIAASEPPDTKPVVEPNVAENPQVEQLKVTAEDLARPAPKPPTEKQLAIQAEKAANDKAAAEAFAQQQREQQAARQGPGQAAFPEPPKPPPPGLESLEMPGTHPLDRITLEGMLPDRSYEPNSFPPAQPEHLALLKQIEAQKGYVEPHDLTPDLRQTIGGEMALSRLQDEIDSDYGRDRLGKRIWQPIDPYQNYENEPTSARITGSKSPVPQRFQGRYTYEELSNIISRGLRGEKLGPKATVFFDRLRSHYQKRDSFEGAPDVSEDDILSYANMHGFDVKTKSIWENEQETAARAQETTATEGPTDFDPVELERQMHEATAEASHKAADELEGMGAGEAAQATRDHAHASEALAQQLEDQIKPKEPDVVRNPPASPGLQDEAAFELGVRGFDADNPDEVAALAAQQADLSKPVETKTGEVPVSKSTEYPEKYQADLAAGKPYEVVHEISHMKDAESGVPGVADRGKNYGRGEGQQDLFADLEKVSQGATSVMHGAGGVPKAPKVGEGSGVRTLASAVLEGFRKRGRLDFAGQVAQSPADIAVIGQLARDPRTETSRIFYVDAEGKILAHEAMTSSMPDIVRGGGTPKYWSAVRSRMRRLGAEGYYLLHNHPSGRAVASVEDVTYTQKMAENVPGLKGHIVVDHDEYALIDGRGRHTNNISLPQEAGVADQHPDLSPSERLSKVARELGVTKDALTEVLSTSRVAKLGFMLKSPKDWVTLIYADNQRVVRAVQEMPVNLFETATSLYSDAGNFIRGRTRDFGGVNVMAYAGPETELSQSAIKMLMQSGVLRDVVHGSGAEYESGADRYGPMKNARLGLKKGTMGTPSTRIGEPPPGQAAWEAEHGGPPEEEAPPEAPPPAGAPPEPPPPPGGGAGTPEGPGANDKLLGAFLQRLRGGDKGHFWNRSQEVKTDLAQRADQIVRTAYQNQIVNEQHARIGAQGTIGQEGTGLGGKAAEATREKFRELPVKPDTYSLLFSQEQIAHVNKMIDEGMTLVRAFADDVRKYGDPISVNAGRAMDKVMEDLTKQMVTLRYAAGRSVKQFDRPGAVMARGDMYGLSPEVIDNLQSLGRLADGLRDAKIRRPIYTNIYESLKHWDTLDPGQKTVLWRNVVDAFRLNLFSVTSFTLDMITNLGELSGQIAEAGGKDLFSLSKGQVFPHLRGFMQALKYSDWNKDVMAQLRGPTVGGEMITTPRLPGLGGSLTPREQLFEDAQKWGTFTERSNPASAFLDTIVGGPLYAKGYFDQAAAHFASQAALFAEANKAMPEGLTPIQRQLWRREFVQNPPEAAITQALEQGNKAKFNRPLTTREENIANSTAYRLLGDTFARWPFQFTRWFGEMVGADPAAFRKIFPKGWSNALQQGGINGEALSGYLVKSATGLGALYMLNQTMYDHVDFHSMEYVDDQGGRYRLTGREPLPTALTALALFNAVVKQNPDDWEKFKSALQFSSVPFGKIGSFTGGLLYSVVKASTLAQSNKKIDPGGMSRDITDALNSAIPGQAVLSALKTLLDPTVREGFGAKLPGVSFFKPAVPSPTTGQELQPRQSLFGSPSFPSFGGVPIPGAKRELDPVYRLLMRFGTPVYRGPQTALVGQPAGALDDLEAQFREKAGLVKMPDKDELRREFESELGYARTALLQPIAARLKTLPGGKFQIGDSETLDYETMRKFITGRDAMAAKLASRRLLIKYGVMAKPQRQPTLRELQGPQSWLEDLRGSQMERQKTINEARE